MQKVAWIGCGLATACLGWTLQASCQYPVISDVRTIPDKGPRQETGHARAELSDHDRLMEIMIELAWLADPLTSPCSLRARVSEATLLVTGQVSSARARERAVRLARMYWPMGIVEKLSDEQQPAAPSTSIDAAPLQETALSLLRTSFPQESHRFRLYCDAEGKMKVSGFVASFEEKLAVSRTLRLVPGCSLVVNDTHVVPDGPPSGYARDTRRTHALETAVSFGVPLYESAKGEWCRATVLIDLPMPPGFRPGQ